MLTKFWCLLFLLTVLLACKFGASDGNSDSARKTKGGPNAELCRKYDSCGCQAYDDCMAEAEDSQDLEKPGVRECMLQSSCESLCAGKPDGCLGQSKPGRSGSTGAERSNCAAISCSRNEDCPSDCYGGCDGVRCYSF